MATTASELEHYLLELINASRAAEGLNPLTMELNLNQSAHDHSVWMSDNLTFSHKGVGDSKSSERMIDAGTEMGDGFNWGSGENIAAQSGYTSENDRGREQAELLHQNFMNSSGHRANILDPDYTHVGLGITYGPMDYNGSVRQSVIVTENFAYSNGRLDEDHRGTSSNERLAGERGDDMLNGMGGNDTLDGGGGTDTGIINDNFGNITASAVSGGILITSADGTDTFIDVEQFQFNDQTVSYDELAAFHLAEVTEENDVWSGTGRNDEITTTTANETIDGGAGDDTIDGKAGDDSIEGGDGNDFLKGGKGNDVLRGGEGTNKLVGQKGDDHLIGGDGKDRLNGGGNKDTLEGGSGDDFLKGGTRDDSLVAGGGDDRLFGNRHDDTLKGGGGNDNLNGGGENDSLIGGGGDDTLKGGDGEDVFVFSAGADLIKDHTGGVDSIEIDAALGGRDVDAILAGADTSGGRTVIDFGNGDVLTIEGNFTLSQLATDIDFFS